MIPTNMRVNWIVKSTGEHSATILGDIEQNNMFVDYIFQK